ncbi:aldehyde dehydrogenase [Streptomyces sp. NPDC096311]|uniref:aldehyde dehydrogenase n=1 Tax=Streptomyces sp. NPDC096311 TaxID=3366083 RepID=UPI0037FBA24F
MLEFDRLFIGGQWRAPAGPGRCEVVSPATEQVMGRLPAAEKADMDAAVAAARAAFDTGPWPRMSFEERAEITLRLADHLVPRAEELALLQTDEMGAPVRFTRPSTAHVVRGLIERYIETVRAVELRELRQGGGGPSLVIREPVGVVAAVIPWNAPLGLILSKMLPATLTGCTVVVKPAPETPLDGYAVGEAVRQAGYPDGVVSIVPADREVGEHLVAHPDVDMVTFTGSTAAGRRIGAICGEQVKRVSLELGGKSAALVLEDADLERDIPKMVNGAMQNNGQICAAITRVLAPVSRYQEVADRYCAAVSELTVGDPRADATDIGPLVSARQRDRVEGYLASGREQGAEVAVGGGRPAGLSRGWFVEPTVFVDVDNAMRIAREEIFGPVSVIIPYATEADAVRIANDSPYGLSGSVFTADVERGIDVAGRIRTGQVTVNDFRISSHAPFGGFKCSGIGREGGPEGVGAYLEYKSVNLPEDAAGTRSERAGTVRRPGA